MNRVEAIGYLADITLNPKKYLRSPTFLQHATERTRKKLIFPDVKLTSLLRDEPLHSSDFLSSFIQSYLHKTRAAFGIECIGSLDKGHSDNAVLAICSKLLLILKRKEVRKNEEAGRIYWCVGILLRRTNLFELSIEYLRKAEKVQLKVIHIYHKLCHCLYY